MDLLAVIQTFTKNQAGFYFLDLELLSTAMSDLLTASQWSNVRRDLRSLELINQSANHRAETPCIRPCGHKGDLPKCRVGEKGRRACVEEAVPFMCPSGFPPKASWSRRRPQCVGFTL